jgi:hypothetical protein
MHCLSQQQFRLLKLPQNLFHPGSGIDAMESNSGAQRFPIRVRHALQVGHKRHWIFRSGRMVQKTTDQNGRIYQGKRRIQPKPGCG